MYVSETLGGARRGLRHDRHTYETQRNGTKPTKMTASRRAENARTEADENPWAVLWTTLSGFETRLPARLRSRFARATAGSARQARRY